MQGEMTPEEIAREMAKTCKICGRRQPLWVGPPLGERECAFGGFELCEDAKNAARSYAMRRKICPEAFNPDGTIIKPHGLGLVLDAMHAAGISFFTGLPEAQGDG